MNTGGIVFHDIIVALRAIYRGQLVVMRQLVDTRVTVDAVPVTMNGLNEALRINE
jgi:hypothetical protein